MAFRSLIAVWLVLTFSAALSMTPASAQNIVAHRGASYDAPENTVASMKLAFEQGADGVEADFYLTSAGHIICCHVKDTERTAGVKHVIVETSLEVLRKLDVGSWKNEKYRGEKMPTFAEIAETIPDGKKFIIELKVGPEIAAWHMVGASGASKRGEYLRARNRGLIIRITERRGRVRILARTLPQCALALGACARRRQWDSALGGILRGWWVGARPATAKPNTLLAGASAFRRP